MHFCAAALRMLLVTALSAFSASWVSSADVILMGGHIYTAEAQSPAAEAVVIEGDTIAFVGSRREAERYRTSATRVISTEGKMVLPGFHDAHLHTFMGGRSLVGCDVANAPDLAVYRNATEVLSHVILVTVVGGRGTQPGIFW